MSSTKKNLTYYKKKVERNTLTRDEMDIIKPLIDDRLQVLRSEERELAKLRQTVDNMITEHDAKEARKNALSKGEELIARFGPDVIIDNLRLYEDVEDEDVEDEDIEADDEYIEDEDTEEIEPEENDNKFSDFFSTDVLG